MKIKIKKLKPNAVLPKKGTDGAAAYDIYLPENMQVKIGRNKLDLGFSMEIPYGYEAKIEPRSGNSLKGITDSYGLRRDADVMVGKIDSDYRGPVSVIVKNWELSFVADKRVAIAQMTIYKVEDAEMEESDLLSETERGSGGFGHTDEKLN